MTRAPNSVPCPRCAAVLPPGVNFCRRCGIGLTRPPVPPSLQGGPVPLPQARLTSLTTKKPTAARKNGSGTSLLPLLLVGVFVLNALRAYQRNTHHVAAPPLPAPPTVVSPRFFTPPTPLLSPAPPTPTVPSAPAQSPHAGPRQGSVDELHWSDTPRWSPHRDARDGDPWHPVTPRSRANGGDR